MKIDVKSDLTFSTTSTDSLPAHSKLALVEERTSLFTAVRRAVAGYLCEISVKGIFFFLRGQRERGEG